MPPSKTATRVAPKQGGTPVVNRYTAVYVKREGKWLVGSVRESSAAAAEDGVRGLEWMRGDWVDEGDAGVILSTCRWSPDKTCLNREFKVRAGDREVMTGTQRIGWDPRAGQIKSWEFDSQGGHGEGL